VYSFADVLDLFPDEFPSLRAGRFPFFLVPTRALKRPLVRHDGSFHIT
jgi:hypothetical protein